MAPSADAPDAESYVERAFHRTYHAYCHTSGGWDLSIHSALEELMLFLEESPERTAACPVISPDIANAHTLERRDELLGRFTSLLEPGYAITPDPPPLVVSEAIANAIVELIQTYVSERRLAHLSEAVPDATRLALAPFLGNEHAELVATGSVACRRHGDAGRFSLDAPI